MPEHIQHPNDTIIEINIFHFSSMASFETTQ